MSREQFPVIVVTRSWLILGYLAIVVCLALLLGGTV